MQRKVERLSAGVMWPRPIEEGGPGPSDDEAELGATLALRRVSLEDAAGLVADFAGSHPETDANGWTRIFVGAFDRINRNRTDLVRGIERYATSQHGLSGEIDALRAKMDTALAASDPDYDQIDAMETDLDWKQRIFARPRAVAPLRLRISGAVWKSAPSRLRAFWQSRSPNRLFPFQFREDDRGVARVEKLEQ